MRAAGAVGFAQNIVAIPTLPAFTMSAAAANVCDVDPIAEATAGSGHNARAWDTMTHELRWPVGSAHATIFRPP